MKYQECKNCAAYNSSTNTSRCWPRCDNCIHLMGEIPSEFTKSADLIAKEVLAEMSGGSPEDSLHDLAAKLLFGKDGKPDFKYEDVSKESKMSPERFKELLDELDGNSLNTLKEKNARYATDGDCLHNFRSGAEIAGGTPAQACWGYVTKHLTALRDMVMKNDFSNREDFFEKCQDTINYIRFLWCIGNDEIDSKKDGLPEDKYVEYCKTDVQSTMELYDNLSKRMHTDNDYRTCRYFKEYENGAETCTKLGHHLYCDGRSCMMFKSNRERAVAKETETEEQHAREIRVYSISNGMLYANIKGENDQRPYVILFDDCFVVHGVENCKSFNTEYSFENFYCVVIDRRDDRVDYRFIDSDFVKNNK